MAFTGPTPIAMGGLPIASLTSVLDHLLPGLYAEDIHVTFSPSGFQANIALDTRAFAEQNVINEVNALFNSSDLLVKLQQYIPTLTAVTLISVPTTREYLLFDVRLSF